MNCVRKVTEDLYWVGADDHRLSLFENIHPIPRGVSYNSYLLMDEKTVLFDTVDWSAARSLLENMESVLQGRSLDYLVIHHMEPDHGASIEEVLLRNPNCTIVSTEKSFMLMHQFGINGGDNILQVKEGDTLCFGKHTVTFIESPMVHWPEVMVTYDVTNGVLFSADAFGAFGALNGKLFADEVDFERDWIEDARRYYTNIVGKYGPFVQALLKKASTVDIKMICPLHGPVWRKDIGYFVDKHDKWSKYEPEEKGVLIAYASMYGNTERAAEALASSLAQKGITNYSMYDVSNTDPSVLIAEAFKYSHMVLASVTYNLEVYPKMQDLLSHMKMLNLQKRTVGIIENGSWACKSGTLMRQFLDGMKQMTVLEEQVSITSSMNADSEAEINTLAEAIAASIKKKK